MKENILSEKEIKSLESRPELSVKDFYNLAKALYILEHNSFDPDKDIPEEKPTVWVETDNKQFPICTPGSMVLVVGAKKSRKTAVMAAICSAILAKKKVLGFTSCLQGSNVMYFDTEQRKGTFWKLQRRILSQAGIKAKLNNYQAVLLREQSFMERLQAILDIIKIKTLDGQKPEVIFIDGALDLVKDFNDHIEAGALADQLMKITSQGITLFMVVHLSNAGTINGHLGSVLGRKVDYVIDVTMKDEGKGENGKPLWSKYSIVAPGVTRDLTPFSEFEIYQDSFENIVRTDLKPDPEEIVKPTYKPIVISGDRHRVDGNVPF